MKMRWRPLVVVSIGVVMLIAIFAIGWWGGLRINTTPSFPIGLWRIAPPERPVGVGDTVFICPPPSPAFELAFDRGYLRRGLCPGWFSPLIKTVVAVGGQQIDVSTVVTIDGRPLVRSEVHGHDAEGRALAPFAGGIVPAGELFLHSDYPGSYDSRYFGPAPASGVLGLARPVLTFTP